MYVSRRKLNFITHGYSYYCDNNEMHLHRYRVWHSNDIHFSLTLVIGIRRSLSCFNTSASLPVSITLYQLLAIARLTLILITHAIFKFYF